MVPPPEVRRRVRGLGSTRRGSAESRQPKGAAAVRTLVVGMAYTVHTVPVEDFPVAYQRMRDVPITTSVGGSGFVVARTLAGYGNEVFLAAPPGDAAAAARAEERRVGEG